MDQVLRSLINNHGRRLMNSYMLYLDCVHDHVLQSRPPNITSYTAYLSKYQHSGDDGSPDQEESLSVGRCDFVTQVRSLEVLTKARIKPYAFLGDRMINDYLHVLSPSAASWRRSNQHFVEVLAPFYQGLGSIHTQGDRIEAAFYLTTDHGRAWFKSLL